MEMAPDVYLETGRPPVLSRRSAISDEELAQRLVEG